MERAKGWSEGVSNNFLLERTVEAGLCCRTLAEHAKVRASVAPLKVREFWKQAVRAAQCAE